MPYTYTCTPQNVWPAKSFAGPKTHTPGSRVKNLGLRCYSPTLGRWANRDPIGDEAFLRRFVAGRPWKQQKQYREASLKPVYTFVANNPVSKIDPFGLATLTPWDGQVHGNWCGGGWTAGRKLDANDYDWENDPNPEVTDKLDACCRVHDACYANWDLKTASPKTGRADTDACDAALCNCARRRDVGGGSANAAVQCWMCRKVDRAQPDPDQKCCLIVKITF